MFGFLFIVFIILIITCAEVTIVLCYWQLCNEDYHWWWRSYLTPGSSALYLYLYSVLYFFTKSAMSVTHEDTCGEHTAVSVCHACAEPHSLEDARRS